MCLFEASCQEVPPPTPPTSLPPFQLLSSAAPPLLDLLIDGLQLFLQHDGQSLHVRLSAGGQQLGAKPGIPVVLIIGATDVHARLEPGPQQAPALPVWVLITERR